LAIEEAPVRLRLGVLRTQFNDPLITAEVRTALEGALERLSASHEIVEVDDAPFAAIRETIDDIILYEAWGVHGDVVTATPMHFGPETLRLLQAAEHVSREQYDTALATRADLLGACDAAYAEVDALVTPATPYVAPFTTPPIDTPEGQAEGRFSGQFNVTGDPAVVVPVGFTAGGLPVGIQFSAPRGHDMALLAVARRVEGLLV
jgi:Asp-tRNA(Asn)/Glu-tRNA(Gln) amidotransferase A subunit family amidase